MDDLQSSQAKENEPGLFSKALKILAVPVSLLVGGKWGHGYIRDKSYSNLKTRGAFKTEYDKLNHSAQQLFPAWGETKDIAADLRSLDAAFSAKVDQRFRDLGYKNIWDRYKSLHKNQRLEAALTAVTAATISLGVILTIADHKSLFNRLFGSDKNDDISK